MREARHIDDLDFLAEGLTHADPVARCMARAVASGFPEKIAEWATAEAMKPKASPADILQALCRLQAQVYSSIAIALVSESADDAAKQLYLEISREMLETHAPMARQAMQGRRS